MKYTSALQLGLFDSKEDAINANRQQLVQVCARCIDINDNYFNLHTTSEEYKQIQLKKKEIEEELQTALDNINVVYEVVFRVPIVIEEQVKDEITEVDYEEEINKIAGEIDIIAKNMLEKDKRYNEIKECYILKYKGNTIKLKDCTMIKIETNGLISMFIEDEYLATEINRLIPRITDEDIEFLKEYWKNKE